MFMYIVYRVIYMVTDLSCILHLPYYATITL